MPGPRSIACSGVLPLRDRTAREQLVIVIRELIIRRRFLDPFQTSADFSSCSWIRSRKKSASTLKRPGKRPDADHAPPISDKAPACEPDWRPVGWVATQPGDESHRYFWPEAFLETRPFDYARSPCQPTREGGHDPRRRSSGGYGDGRPATRNSHRSRKSSWRATRGPGRTPDVVVDLVSGIRNSAANAFAWRSAGCPRGSYHRRR